MTMAAVNNCVLTLKVPIAVHVIPATSLDRIQDGVLVSFTWCKVSMGLCKLYFILFVQIV